MATKTSEPYISFFNFSPIVVGITLNLASTLFMSMGPIINKFALSTISPAQGAMLCALFGGILCYLFSLLTKQPIQFPKSNAIILVSILNGIAILCLFSAQSYLNPMIVGFMGRFYVVFTTIFSVLLLREKASIAEWVLIGFAVLSSFLLNFKGTQIESGIGIALIILQTFLFALVNTLVKKKLNVYNSNSILFYNIISSAFIFVFILFNDRSLSLMQISVTGMLWILLSAFVSSFLGILLFYKGIKYISFAESNLIRSTSPIFTALFSSIFFPVVLFSKWNILGAFLLIFSILALAAIKLDPVKKFLRLTKV